MGYSGYEFMPCEICGGVGVDIHHIDCRGMGGTKTKDHIENLMLLCREDHIKYGDKTEYKEFLKETHKSFLEVNGIKTNR